MLFALSEIGEAFLHLGQFQEAERSMREAVAIGRQLGDLVGPGRILHRLAGVLARKGEFAESLSLLEECLAIAGHVGDLLLLSAAHWAGGITKAHLGHYDQGRVFLQQGLALARELGFPWLIATAQYHLYYLALAEEQHAEAQQGLQESVATFQEIGMQSDMGWPLALLAGAERGLGRLSEACQHLCDALQIAAEMRGVITLMYALPIVALLLADEGEAERAVEIYALASRYGFVANSRLWEDIAGREIAALAATLPPDVGTAAQARGRARDLEATVKELLEDFTARRL
jgi:tetratricopeptide (TPR) repeat protein